MTRPDESSDTPRTDPTWVWYSIAAAVLVVVLALELSGVLAMLGP